MSITLDETLIALAMLTPEAPHQWVWPRSVPQQWRQHLLDNQTILLTSTPFHHRWARAVDTLSEQQLNQVQTKMTERYFKDANGDFIRGGTIEWLRAHTIEEEWWSFPKGSPLFKEMHNAGIRYNTAYVALKRAMELGQVVKANGKWKWNNGPGFAHTSDTKLSPLVAQIRHLSQAERRTILLALQGDMPGQLMRNGLHEFRADSFEKVPTDTGETFILHGTMYLRGNKLYPVEVCIDPPKSYTDELMRKFMEDTPRPAPAAPTLSVVLKYPTSDEIEQMTEDELEARMMAIERAEQAALADQFTFTADGD
jgi:hypothetical protein